MDTCIHCGKDRRMESEVPICYSCDLMLTTEERDQLLMEHDLEEYIEKLDKGSLYPEEEPGRDPNQLDLFE